MRRRILAVVTALALVVPLSVVPIVGASSGTGLTSAFAEWVIAQEQADTDLSARIDALEARVAALEAGAPPATTTTTVATTTTTVAPTTTTLPSTTTTALAEVGYGAPAVVGPARERATTIGQVITSPGQMGGPGVYLLRGGSYGSVTVPAGATLLPYNGESVAITGSVSLGDGSTIAGMTVNATGQWAIRLNRDSASPYTDQTIRNMHLVGGTIETIRASRNIQDFLIEGSILEGSGNHLIKTHGEGGPYTPSGTIRYNLLLNAGEDSIQAEPGNLVIEANTFDGADEDNLDLKGGTITVTRNRFVDADEGAILTHGTAHSVIDDNSFEGGNVVSLGSNNSLSQGVGASMEYINNTMSPANLWIRRSVKVIVIEANDLSGGRIRLGTTASGDFPANVWIIDNNLAGVDLENPHGVDYTYEGNLRVGGSGWN